MDASYQSGAKQEQQRDFHAGHHSNEYVSFHASIISAEERISKLKDFERNIDRINSQTGEKGRKDELFGCTPVLDLLSGTLCATYLPGKSVTGSPLAFVVWNF